jgi:hypothetical protein
VTFTEDKERDLQTRSVWLAMTSADLHEEPALTDSIRHQAHEPEHYCQPTAASAVPLRGPRLLG